MSTTSKHILKTSPYPFGRRQRVRFPDWSKFHCKICGASDYADWDSPSFKKGVCVDCEVNHVIGKEVCICKKHGKYWGWHVQNGQIYGNCPVCIEKNEKFNNVIKQYGCLCIAIISIIVGYFAGLIWLWVLSSVIGAIAIWRILTSKFTEEQLSCSGCLIVVGTILGAITANYFKMYWMLNSILVVIMLLIIYWFFQLHKK